jgi:hypothetical protein
LFEVVEQGEQGQRKIIVDSDDGATGEYDFQLDEQDSAKLNTDTIQQTYQTGSQWAFNI